LLLACGMLYRAIIGGLIMRGTILTAVLFAATLGGCYTTGTVAYSPGYADGGGEVYAATPDLVTVSPGVQVVADYDEPVFFTDGFYWRFYDGYWYRSNNYATGWYYYERPPVTVLRIDRPYAYAHYRPTGYVARNRPRYRPAEVIARDRRQPAYRPEPVVRDHREPTYREAPRPAPNTYREAPRPAPTTYREAPPPAANPTYREAQPAARPAPAPAPTPTVRDHRQAPPPAKDDGHTRDHRH
jgi:hypothetical protein